MPLTTPQQKNAQSYNAIKNGLYSLNKFTSANGSDDLFILFTENKKIEIDDLFFTPPRQSNLGTSQKGKVIDLLTITNGWFLSSNKGDPENIIREKVFGLFNFNTKKMMGLRKELDKYKDQKNNEQAIINQLEAFEKKIDKLTPDETFKYINLYISVRWDNILSLVRLKEIQNSLSAKKFTLLSPENYELLKNKQVAENLTSQDTNKDLSFSKLGRFTNWLKIKNAILNDLVPPQTDSLSSDSIPSSSNTEINPSTSANYNANPVENSSASTDTSVSITPSIDTQIVINESAQNQEIAQLKKTKKGLEEKSQSLEVIKANLETQISELKIILQTNEDTQQQESESNKQKLENLQITLASSQKNTKDKEVELEALNKLKEDYFLSLESAKSDLQKTKKEKNDLTTKLHETEVKIKTLEANNTKLAAEIDKTTAKLIETTDTLELRSSDHIEISKQLNDLQTQHSALQNFLKNQKSRLQEDLKTKEADNNLLHTEVSKLNDEIGLTKRKLSDTEIKLNSANQKYDESKKTTDNLQLNKIELITQKKEIQDQLFKQKDTHQALVRNHELLIAESTKKDRDLEKQKNVIIKVEGELKTKIGESALLKKEIKEKDKQIEEQRQKVSKINEALQEREKEFQEISGQLDTIKHQLREANEGEKTAREKLATNELKMQELEPLKEQISQAKESYNELNLKLHSKENKTANLVQELNTLNEEVSAFIQTMQNELNKLNPKEPQTYQELDSIDTKHKITIDSTIFLDEDVTGTSSNNDRVTEKLDLLKLKTISSVNLLINKSAIKEQQLTNKEKVITELKKELESSLAEIKILGQQVTGLNAKIKEFEQLNEQENYFPKQYLNPEEELSYEEFENLDDDSDIQIELAETRKLLHDTQGKLQQKIDELSQLQSQLKSQETLQVEMDALKRSFEEAAETLSVLKSEKGKLNKDLKDAQEALQTSKSEINNLQDELGKLQKNDSSNQEAISKLTNQIQDLKALDLQKEESIEDLTKKIVINSSLIEEKENQIESLNKTLAKTQGKSGQLENRNGQLEEQTIKMQQDIDQLTDGAIALPSQIEELTIEKENLNQNLKDAQEALQTSKSEINNLQVEIEKQQTNKSTDKDKISELTQKIKLFEELKGSQENSIKGLTNQIQVKDNEIRSLTIDISKLIEQKNTAIRELEGKLDKKLKQIDSLEKYEQTLTTEIEKLVVENESLNQSASDAKEAIATLNEKLETKQKDDSNLKVDHAKLGTELSEKILELNKIQTELKSTKEQLEEARAKNIRQGDMGMPITGENLIDFGSSIGEDHPDQIHHKPNSIDKNGSSSGNSSRQSSSNSHASSESVNASPPPFSHYRNPSSEDEAFTEPTSLETNSSNSSLTRSHSLPDLTAPSVNTTTSFNHHYHSTRELTNLGTEHLEERPIINPINTGTPMPISEQQDVQVDNTSSIHERGVINAFNEEHHEAISRAFTAEFARLATVAATTLFNGNIVTNYDLPTFKNELDEKANKEVTHLILALSNKKELLSGIIEKIHTQGLTALNYLEEVKNSASDIFESLKIKRQGEAEQTYKDYIKDIGANLVIKLCAENLQTEAKANLPQLAKRELENKIITNRLLPIEQHTETIKIAAEELVTNILKADKLKSIIEDAKNDPTAGVNLLEASKQKLQEQLEQEVDQSFDHYFPIVHLNPIFQKIKDGDVLSEEEIQKIPSELQYADTIKDFVSGLRVKYSHLSSDYEGKIDDNNFKNLRLILRKKALVDTNQVIPKDNEIIDLDAKAWLEKKLQLITGKSVNLELVKLEKEQENLLNELSSSLQISTFYDIAITRKTIPELTQEIEKANKAQLSAAEQISQIYKKIESKQTAYPKLIDDEAIAGFRANLNQHLENSSITLEVNNKQTKTLLMGINQRLKKDISKWDFFDKNTLQREITNDILANPERSNFTFDEADTVILVQHAMLVLRDNYPNDTLEKRKQWLKNIALLHAITKKLATFSPKIKENIAKFEDLRVRKEEDINQLEEPAANKIADAVYLPHRHTIIANSLDPNLAKRLPADFEILDGAFYKQDPLQIGQTLTFALSLHNGEEQKCSVTRDETCLAYKIHTPWLNIVNKIKDGVANKMTYARSNTNSSKQFNTEEETLFTLLTHAVNSSKGPTHTIMLGKNCSNEKERFIRLFVEKFNAEQKLSSKKTILLANANDNDNDNDKLKIHSDDKKTIYNKIHKANSLTEELDNATTRTIDTLNRHITRPRG